MAFEYNGVVYRDLEPQVRYDAEQVQLLKQADVTINENLQTVNESLQTVNTELNSKLTKPANPSAESAVTMLADGTVGTKPLSEIGGGGKLYRHTIRGSFAGNDGELQNANITLIEYRSNDVKETNPKIFDKKVCSCDCSNNIGDNLMGAGRASIDNSNNLRLWGVLENNSASPSMPEILNYNLHFLSITDTVTEL